MSQEPGPFDTYGQDPEPPFFKKCKQIKTAFHAKSLSVYATQEREGLILLAPTIEIRFLDESGSILTTETFTWEQKVDLLLITGERARACNEENEKLRFSFHLIPNLRPILVQFGDGFFNTVLINALKGEQFRKYQDLWSTVSTLHRNPIDSDDSRYCKALLHEQFSIVYSQLVFLYASTKVDPTVILAGALAKYMDDRFSISNRRLLGF